MSVVGSSSGATAGATAKSQYDALRDPDLQRFLFAPQTQQTLLTAGLLTPDGRILDTDSPGVKGRIRVIEQELVGAAEEEAALKREEATVRVSLEEAALDSSKRPRTLPSLYTHTPAASQARVRALRIQQLEEERRAKMVAIRQEQAAIREEVSHLTRLLTGGGGVTQWQPPAPSPQPAQRQPPPAAPLPQRTGAPAAAAASASQTPLRAAGGLVTQAGAGPARLTLAPVFSTPAAAGASRGLRGAAPAR